MARGTINYIEKYGDKSLNDIFEIDDAYELDRAVAAWVMKGDEMEDDKVKIVTSDGKPLPTSVTLDGKRLVVGPNGRVIRRKLAAHLLALYGQRGRHTGTDQATGYSPVQWATYKAQHPEIAAALAAQMNWEGGKPAFLLNYLKQFVEPEPATVEAVAS